MKQTLSIKSNLFMVRELRDYLGIALGMILYGIGWTVFLLPNDFAFRGGTGSSPPLSMGDRFAGAIHLFCH